MATPTLTTDLTVIANGEATDTGTWTGGKSSAYITIADDGEAFLHGTGSRAYIVNQSTTYDCLYTETAAIGLASTDVLRIWVMMSDFQRLNTMANGGMKMIMGDGTNTAYYDYYGSDTYPGGWTQLVLDVDATPSSGTKPVAANIDRIGVHVNLISIGKNISTLWIDVMRYGNKINAYGGTGTSDTIDLSGIAAVDKTNSYGILEEKNGIFNLRGELNLGDTASTNHCYFSDDGQVILCPDLPWSATDTFKLTVAGNATGVTDIDLTNSFLKAIGDKVTIDASDGNIDDLDFNGCSFANTSTVDFASGQSILNSKFDGCGQIDPSTSTFTSNTISNSVDTGGALLWPTSGNTTNITFLNCDYGVEIVQTTNQSFSGLIFDDEAGNYDVHLNNGGTSIEVAKTSGSNPNSYIATGGGVVTFTASYSHIIQGLELNTEVTYVTADTSTELYHVESASTSDGSGKYQTTYTHGGGASVDILLHHVDYQPDISNIYGLTLPEADATVKVSMFTDVNYLNPS